MHILKIVKEIPKGVLQILRTHVCVFGLILAPIDRLLLILARAMMVCPSESVLESVLLTGASSR